MKTILITGSTDGIGLGAARALASEGHRVLLHGRSADKLEAAKADIAASAPHAEIATYRADLSNPQEVVDLAKAVASGEERIDALLNNAGVVKTPQTVGASGHDTRFLVNTFAPIILTRGLMDRLAPDARVVNTSSAAQAPIVPEQLSGAEPTSDDFSAYSQSKLALTMWSRRMAAAHPQGPFFCAVNPGSLLATKMVVEGFGMDGNDPTKGYTILKEGAVGALFDGHSGEYFDNDAGNPLGDWGSPHADALDDAKCDEVLALIDAELEKLGVA
ncbi:MAG: SDR family NAD(P)-dependent oxidoreductase [Pseudomonadota bacterium]